MKVMSGNAGRLIDGRGAERIAGIISGLCKNDKSSDGPGRGAVGEVRHA